MKSMILRSHCPWLMQREKGPSSNHCLTLITTNSSHFRSEFIVSQQAIAQRIHLVVKVTSVGGIPNREKDAEISLDNIQCEIGFVKQDGSNDILFTGILISPQALVHYILTQIRLRERIMKRDAYSLETITNNLLDEYRPMVLDAINTDLKFILGRKPSLPETIYYIKGCYDELKETFDMRKAGLS